MALPFSSRCIFSWHPVAQYPQMEVAVAVGLSLVGILPKPNDPGSWIKSSVSGPVWDLIANRDIAGVGSRLRA